MKNTKISATLFLILFISVACFGLSQSEENTAIDPLAGIEASERISIAFMISVLILKITAFVLGYLIVKLGHDTLIKGITGEFNFGFTGSGFSAKLKSASPGALFVLMGSAIIIWSMTVEKPFKVEAFPAETKESKTTVPNSEQKDPIPGVGNLQFNEAHKTKSNQ